MGQILRLFQPTLAVLVGIAGSVKEKVKVGSVVVPTRAINMLLRGAIVADSWRADILNHHIRKRFPDEPWLPHVQKALQGAGQDFAPGTWADQLYAKMLQPEYLQLPDDVKAQLRKAKASIVDKAVTESSIVPVLIEKSSEQATVHAQLCEELQHFQVSGTWTDLVKECDEDIKNKFKQLYDDSKQVHDEDDSKQQVRDDVINKLDKRRVVPADWVDASALKTVPIRLDGAIISCDVVLKNTNIAKRLAASRDFLAVEMEGYAFLKACAANKSLQGQLAIIPGLVVRGISDPCEDKGVFDEVSVSMFR